MYEVENQSVERSEACAAQSSAYVSPRHAAAPHVEIAVRIEFREIR